MKLEDITYRRARNGDSEIIKRILKTTLDEYDIKLPEKYTFSDIEDLEEEYINASGEFMVLLRGQKIIGFFALRPSGNNQVELKRLYLKAGERGRGLGKHLLNMALKMAKESGYARIHLETTSKFVEAVALYRKFGFNTNVGATLSQGHEIGLKRGL
jgi:putative acetyltransferase